MTSPEPSDVDALIAEFIQAVERGQSPDPADWLARHPAHAADLARFLHDLGQFGTFLGLSFHASEVTKDFRHPAAPPDVLTPGTPGERFGEYELLEVIGQGGMGTVYRARLADTNLVVALKQVRTGGSGAREAARWLREEAENAAGLRHPNIVPIYYVGEHAGQPFYTMALVEGGSLDQCLGRFQGDFGGTAALLARTARAVHYAHQRRVLHRDLKPGNILLGEDGEPHVADFGLATRLDDSGAATDAGQPAGSLP
jgi:serine/threonine protein kinase